MKNLTELVNESKGGVLCHYLDKTGWNHFVAATVEDARKKLPSNVTYYDLQKNDSSSANVNSLIEWHGKGGYWSNEIDVDFIVNCLGEKAPKQSFIDAVKAKEV